MKKPPTEPPKTAIKALALPAKNGVNGRLKIPHQALLIERDMDGDIIHQRPQDGYINATELCKKADKFFANYKENKATREYLEALSLDIGIPISMENQGLIREIAGAGKVEGKGTWVHPQVAIHLAQWLSPVFAVQVNKWVLEWLSGNISGKLPAHLQRYTANMGKIPPGYFSMLNEAIYSLIAPLEQRGYTMSNKLMPDISYGRMFSDFLRQKGINPQEFPTYWHEFTDGKRPTVKCRLYPNQYLGDFRDYLSNVWIPTRSVAYFRKTDPKALPYLQDLIRLPHKPEE